jgi:hypothetical protein
MKTPERPGFNDSVRSKLAKELAITIKQHGCSMGADIETDLYDLLSDQWHCQSDGYELAKYLDDNYGYSPDTNLVEALDCASSLYDGIIEQQSKEWVLAYEIKLSYAIGDKVNFPYRGGKKEGEITRLFPETGKYGIWSDALELEKKETSYHLVELEKVEKV